MEFFNLYQQNLIYFIILSFSSILLINKIFSKIIIKKKIYDLNEKINNNKKVYTGFGFSFVIITFSYLIIFLILEDSKNIYYQIKYLSVPLSIIILGTIGLIDDYKGTPIHIRLTLFFMCCFLSTSALSNNILNFIPFHKLQLIIITLFWVYYVNASNFLDGGDKFFINFILPNSIFFCVYYYFFEPDTLRFQFNLIILIYILNFNFYNREPKKFFLGDTGSLTFGYLYCFNILHLIEKNEFTLAILLSLFILSDVSITLFLRVLKGKNIFSRHKGFFIHISKFLGKSNKETSLSILYVNSILVLLAIFYKLYHENFIIIVLGLVSVIIYLLYLIKFDLKNLKYTFTN